MTEKAVAGFEIIRKSKSKAPSCLKQLTNWVEKVEEIQFCIDQLDKYHEPWALKRCPRTQKVSVFVYGESDHDDPYDPVSDE